MKTIVRRIPPHTVRYFQCEVCKRKYRTANKAKECEAKKTEKKLFKVRDKAKALEMRCCKNRSFGYLAIGVIVKIEGPVLPDYEYEVKWLGGKSERLNAHVFVYWLSFKCPHCGDKIKHLYYGPELKKI